MTIPRRVLLATDFLSKLDIFILVRSPFNQNTARVETSSNRYITCIRKTKLASENGLFLFSPGSEFLLNFNRRILKTRSGLYRAKQLRIRQKILIIKHYARTNRCTCYCITPII